MRLAGRFEVVGDAPIAPGEAEAMVLSALTDAQRAAFEEHGELDLPYGVPELGRFRVNVYRQQRGVDGVFRSIPARPPPWRSWDSPPPWRASPTTTRGSCS